MKLKTILNDIDHCYIQVRSEYPTKYQHDISDQQYCEGIMMGYCNWADGQLRAADDDYYSLEMDITRYEYNKDLNFLVVWSEYDWS